MSSLINSREVIPGLVYRSAAPYQLSAQDVQNTVDELGLGAVADLRSERERKLVPWNGLDATGVQLIDVAISAEANEDTLALQTAEDLGYLYLEWLDLKRESIVRALAPLADETPTLYQCAAGKDRTGMLAALAGMLAGRSRDQIIADYTETNAHMGEVKAAMLEAYRPLIPEAALAHLAEQNAPIIMSAPEQAMAVFIDGIDMDYGGIGGFLNSTHLHPAQAARLRDALAGR